jgi:UDP-glucose 4-epimerase
MHNYRKIEGNVFCIIGGAGFIGSHLVGELLDLGAKKVIIIDNLFLGDKKNLLNYDDNLIEVFIEDAENLSNIEHIFENNNIETVFNCATKALNHSFISPSSSYLVNTNIAINLLEFLRKRKFNTLCQFSTSEVYGSFVNSSMKENHTISPTTTYAAGKAAADLAVKSYVDMFGLDAFIIRPFNNFGPRQNFQGKLAGIIPNTVFRILENKEPIVNGNGLQTREFIYVKDTVRLTLELYRNISSGDCVNLSSDNEISVINLIKTISSILNYSGKFEFHANRVSDVKRHYANIDKLKSIINNVNFTPFDFALRETIDWYINEHGNNKAY